MDFVSACGTFSQRNALTLHSFFVGRRRAVDFRSSSREDSSLITKRPLPAEEKGERFVMCALDLTTAIVNCG